MDDQKKEMWMEHMKDKRKYFAVLIVILSLFLFVLTIKEIKSLRYVGSESQIQNTISVNGKGEIVAVPDIATISFSVTEQSMDVAKATDALNKRIATIVKTLKDNGIAEKDIKTTNYTSYPRYDYSRGGMESMYYPDGGKQVLAGYDVSQSIDVKIRKIDDSGKIVSLLGGLKVTNLYGPNFTNEKYDDLVKQARVDAIKDARTQAETLAKELGVHLVRVVSFNEGGYYPMMYGKTEAVGMGGADSSPTPATLPTGENKITSNVTITYEIR